MEAGSQADEADPNHLHNSLLRTEYGYNQPAQHTPVLLVIRSNALVRAEHLPVAGLSAVAGL